MRFVFAQENATSVGLELALFAVIVRIVVFFALVLGSRIIVVFEFDVLVAVNLQCTVITDLVLLV